MVKRVFIVHGWEGNPQNCWFPWLKKELENKGFQVFVPSMPNSEEPRIDIWVSFLKKQVGNVDKNTYFIGHSIGCQTILRYLQTLDNIKIGGVILVAGWVSLTPVAIRSKEEKRIVKPWFETPLYFDKIKKTTDSFVAIFSDDDPYVPQEKNISTYKEKLDANIIIEKGKGHFADDDNVKELPIVLKELLRISK